MHFEVNGLLLSLYYCYILARVVSQQVGRTGRPLVRVTLLLPHQRVMVRGWTAPGPACWISAGWQPEGGTPFYTLLNV